MAEKIPDNKAPVPAPGNKQLRKPTDWNLESEYDAPATIQDLIDMAPFKEASDTKGGSYTAAARVPTWLERKITWFVEMKGSPYMLKGDVVRDMIYLGARVLHARYKGNPDFATEAKMTEAVSQTGVLAHIKEQVNQLSRGMEELWSEGDEPQAIDLFEKFVAAAVEMRDEWVKMKTFQYIRGNRLLKQIADKCSQDVKNAVYNVKKVGE